ncbi:hypothetical protein [Chitinophaga pinensis]|nr:hypothetical protein [Chitinophaga pinensis]
MKTIITLLKFLLLSEYPSGSAISYYNDQLLLKALPLPASISY